MVAAKSRRMRKNMLKIEAAKSLRKIAGTTTTRMRRRMMGVMQTEIIMVCICIRKTNEFSLLSHPDYV